MERRVRWARGFLVSAAPRNPLDRAITPRSLFSAFRLLQRLGLDVTTQSMSFSRKDAIPVSLACQNPAPCRSNLSVDSQERRCIEAMELLRLLLRPGLISSGFYAWRQLSEAQKQRHGQTSSIAMEV